MEIASSSRVSTGEAQAHRLCGSYGSRAYQLPMKVYSCQKEKNMSHKKSSVVFTLVIALAFVMTLYAMAAEKEQPRQTGQYSQPQGGSQQTDKTPMGSSMRQGQSSQMGTMGMRSGQAISATVEDVDKQQRMITLRPDKGETIELTVPEAMLSDLQAGDSVEVTIRKADKGSHSQSGQSGSMQRQPGQSSPSGSRSN
jgi:Cu/Ag efflux protein CusF